MRVSSLYWGYRSRQIDRNFGRRQICNVEKAALQISCESEMQGQTTNVDYRPWSLVLVFLFRLSAPPFPILPPCPQSLQAGQDMGECCPSVSFWATVPDMEMCVILVKLLEIEILSPAWKKNSFCPFVMKVLHCIVYLLATTVLIKMLVIFLTVLFLTY